MHKIDLLILVLAAVSNIIIALLVYLKNKKHLSHKIFLFLVGSLIFWMTANYFSVSSTDHQAIFLSVKLILASVVLQTTLFFLFVATFPGNKLNMNAKLAKMYLLFSGIVFLVGLYPGFFADYKPNGNSIIPNPSPFIALFMFHTAISIGGGITRLFIRFRNSKGIDKNQLKFLILASSFILVFSPITNFIFPVVFDNRSFVAIGPIDTLLFASIIAYSMVRHRLFDFRSIVAKAFVYLLTFGLATALYISAVFGLSLLFLDEGDLSVRIQVIYTVLAILLAYSYLPIKNFFDRFTNKFFFRDRYDPQEFLDELNKSIVRNIEIGILLRHSTAVIENNLHSSFCQVALRGSDDIPSRIIGTKEINYSEKDLETIKSEIKELNTRTIITDEIPPEQKELKAVLSKHSIDVVVRLTESSYGNQQTIAYIIFGAKKSGNVYSNQDLKIIDIIADELVIAIQNALRFEEIQEFNVTLQKKVNDATGKLRKTNEKLKAMDETKDEFISMASHQLRTPLTSVKGYLSMVLEGDAGEINENQKKLLDQAFVSSQRMVYLIADLLNVSRLRTGKFIIDAHSTNLADVVETEIAQLIEQAKAKNQTLVFDKPKDFPLLTLDETKIRQVIMNFADNALFYTPSGGKIKIELTTDKNHIYFAVKDNGIGVPKDEQKHMFTKFYRAKNARNARPDGTGLGLFMAKKVITAQGGNILFESSEGKGSTFGFSFNKKHFAIENYKAPDEAENPTNEEVSAEK